MNKFLIPLFALAFLLVSCLPSSAPPTPPPGGNAASEAALTPPASFDGTILSGKHTVILHTTLGDITATLDADAAPKTVTNFITLAKNGYYDNLTFHRVIPGFMIQGGDPKGDGTGGESIFGEKFEDEINAKVYGMDKTTVGEASGGSETSPEIANLTLKKYFEQRGYVYNDALPSLPIERGVLAMANSGPNTNGSQFFIVQGNEAPWLNGQHTVFGRVVRGLDVLDAIVAVPRDAKDKPQTPVTFTVEILTAN